MKWVVPVWPLSWGGGGGGGRGFSAQLSDIINLSMDFNGA